MRMRIITLFGSSKENFTVERKNSETAMSASIGRNRIRTKNSHGNRNSHRDIPVKSNEKISSRRIYRDIVCHTL